MLRKLELYGVDTTWFQAYLEGHTQSVTLRDPSGDVRTSKPLKNNIGLFQGSSLGPLLFSIFANDLSLYAEGAEVIQYADDTQVIISGDKENIQAIIHQMEAVLGNIDAWFSANLLKVNASKAELIVFGSSRALSNMPELRISFCNTNIVPCDKVRNLGLIMDSKLSWDAHVGCPCDQPTLHGYFVWPFACSKLPSQLCCQHSGNSVGAIAGQILHIGIW